MTLGLALQLSSQRNYPLICRPTFLIAKYMKNLPLIFVLTLSILTTGCATTKGSTAAEKRAAIDEMRNKVLTELYQEKPDVRQQIATAEGYAVFSNLNISLILASFGGGFGVVKDNRFATDTYMKMGEVGVGLGAGVKDFRIVMVFHDKEALDQFVNNGWTAGAQADAAAKSTDKGGAVGGETSIRNVSIYQLTQSGLALQATVKGTKFWKDKSLNTY